MKCIGSCESEISFCGIILLRIIPERECDNRVVIRIITGTLNFSEIEKPYSIEL